MFKIVETVEKGRKELTIVPANWENNRGTLFFPRRFASKLQREADSAPEPNWLSLPCKVKRKNLSSYDSAEEELDQMVEADDTEKEEQITPSAPRKRARVLLPKKTTNSNSTIVYSTDFNNLANSCIVDNDDIQPPVAVVPAPAENNNHFTEAEEQNLQTYNVIYPASQQTIQLMESINPEIVQTANTDNNKLDIIMATLDTVVENQHKIMKELSNFQVVFEMAMRKRNADNNYDPSRSQNKSYKISPFEPIDCLEDFKKFNDKLKDTEIFNEYVESLSFICGRDTKTKGIDHSYMLVDKFFTRNFFTLCSWAGGAKVPNTKFPFKFYENVIGLFYKLVHLADSRFSLEDCEDFFKSVIRNCVRRNNSSNTRTSRSKKRPKKLSYNARVYENEDGNASVPNSNEEDLTNDEENVESFNEDHYLQEVNPEIS